MKKLLLDVLGKDGYSVSKHDVDLVSKALKKIERIFVSGIDETTKVVIKKKDYYKIEITITLFNTIFRAEDTDRSIIKAINKTVDKLYSQLVKGKEKIKNRFSRRGNNYELEFEEKLNEELYTWNNVTKEKKIILNPISVEDAIFELEQLGHSFYIFKHLETNNICVIYKRTNGEYGLIETE